MKNIFPKRLTICLQESSLPYEKIAQKVGWKSKGTITKYAKGQLENITLSKLEALARVFEVNPAWLAGFSDEKYILK